MAQEPALVLDASVAVKWFHAEPLKEKALAIRAAYAEGTIALHAPTLLSYEVGNALRYKPHFGIEEVKAALVALEDMQITPHPFDGDLARDAVEAAYRYGITLYDAAYVALAAREEARLYTADEEVSRKVRSDWVRHLGRYGE